MTETGRIISINGRRITIKLNNTELCFGCMNHECKEKEGLLSAVNSLNLPLKIGHLVEIETRSSSLVKQGIQAAVFPVIGFIKGFLLTRLIFPSSSEGIKILGALILMFAAGTGYYIFRKKVPPKIISRLTGIIGEAATPP